MVHAAVAHAVAALLAACAVAAEPSYRSGGGVPEPAGLTAAHPTVAGPTATGRVTPPTTTGPTKAARCGRRCTKVCSKRGQDCVAEGQVAGGVPRPCTCASDQGRRAAALRRRMGKREAVWQRLLEAIISTAAPAAAKKAPHRDAAASTASPAVRALADDDYFAAPEPDRAPCSDELDADSDYADNDDCGFRELSERRAGRMMPRPTKQAKRGKSSKQQRRGRSKAATATATASTASAASRRHRKRPPKTRSTAAAGSSSSSGATEATTAATEESP